MDENIDNLFDEKNIPEGGSWFKFEKVGDKIGGVLVDTFDKPGQDDFPDQRVYVIRTKDGDEINVGIKKESQRFVINRLKNARPGDLVGFEFEKEIPPAKKGHNPAKSIRPFLQKTPAGDQVRKDEEDFSGM